MAYFWIYWLGGCAATTVVFFLATLSKDVQLIRRLKKKKTDLLLNFSLLVLSLSSLSLVIYLFVLLKDQIGLIG